MSTPTPPSKVYVEADGGSRGNPGPAAYGALLRDATTGKVIAEAAESIGVATNNVAEYRGLVAGLRLLQEVAPEAEIEVRMDSKLVIEQMSGRWKIKHPDMKPLALQAMRLAPPNVTWTWVPRARNSAADALLNSVLDGGETIWRTSAAETSSSTEDVEADDPEPVVRRGWGEHRGTPTQLLLLRHGATALTAERRFSGSGGDPELTAEGREQIVLASAALTARGGIDVVVSSPLRRARESADIVAAALGLKVVVEPGLAETDFGAWEGSTYAEIGEGWATELESWQRSTAVPPPDGESFDATLVRVRRARDQLLRTYAEQTVLVVTHVTPIKLLAALALGVPTTTIYRMQLAPASLTELHWYPDGTGALHTFGLPFTATR